MNIGVECARGGGEVGGDAKSGEQYKGILASEWRGQGGGSNGMSNGVSLIYIYCNV
ncbi:MAG: hypothetical protein JWM47_4316 [Acidimicrobiales bacterium]|nr:hypothetical protein [Acidimicrobiales bacterium]